MRLIILDTETTGLSPAEGRIVEIAAVEMLDGKQTGREFHHFLNPEHPISEEITEIIGINDAMVAGKPTFADIAQAFIDFVGNGVVAQMPVAAEVGSGDERDELGSG